MDHGKQRKTNFPVIFTKLVSLPLSLSTMLRTPCRTKVFQNLDYKRLDQEDNNNEIYLLLELSSVKPDPQLCLRLDRPLDHVSLQKYGVVDEHISNGSSREHQKKDQRMTTIIESNNNIP